MSNQIAVAERSRVRECLHKDGGTMGQFFPGERYIRALQSLRGEDALELSRKVGPLFWSDAPHTRVWLCADCTREAMLQNQEASNLIDALGAVAVNAHDIGGATRGHFQGEVLDEFIESTNLQLTVLINRWDTRTVYFPIAVLDKLQKE